MAKTAEVKPVSILVCGGRGYRNRERVFEVLASVKSAFGMTDLVHGAAPGADTLAAEWVRGQAVWEHSFPADWAKYGRSAGPIRNALMLEKSRDTLRLVVAFPGGRGTADMVRQATDAGVHVLMVDLHEHNGGRGWLPETEENGGCWVVGGNESPVGPCLDLDALLMGICES